MTDPNGLHHGLHRSAEPQLPASITSDIGIHPSTRLGRRVSPWSAIRRLVRSTHDSGTEDVIAAIPLFRGLSKEQRRRASQLSMAVAVPAGATLTKEGTTRTQFLVILEGEVEVFRGGDVRAVRGPGSPLGQTALLEGGPSRVTLRAKTPISTLVSSRHEFKEMLVAMPEMIERLRAITAERRAA